MVAPLLLCESCQRCANQLALLEAGLYLAAHSVDVLAWPESGLGGGVHVCLVPGDGQLLDWTRGWSCAVYAVTRMVTQQGWVT